jgi:hypothetical protein
MPSLVQAAVASRPVVRGEGGVQLGPLDKEGAAAVRGWLGEGATQEP